MCTCGSPREKCDCEVHGVDNGQWDMCWWGIPQRAAPSFPDSPPLSLEPAVHRHC